MQKIKGITCDNCKVVLYIQSGRPNVIPPVSFPDLKYCPVCGFEAKECNSLDDVFWQSMSYHYGLPVDNMREFYRSYLDYLNDPKSKRQSFNDWFKEVVEEALREMVM